jgi:hypothetical protein
VRVLLTPKRVRLRSATTKELLNNPDGTPLWVPYDNDLDTKDPEKTNRIIEDRPIAEVKKMRSMKGNIETVLNQNAYKLTIGNCPQGDACSCQIPVFFRVEFVTDANKPHHAKVNLFAQATRADSGNWGEENVTRMPQGWKPLETEHVQAHETGHLFSFPDEYYAGGGAIHADYIKDQHVDIRRANESRDKDKWQGVTASNLMGIGVYSATSETPSYYLYRVRNWFNAATGREWKIIPLNKAK